MKIKLLMTDNKIKKILGVMQLGKKRSMKTNRRQMVLKMMISKFKINQRKTL